MTNIQQLSDSVAGEAQRDQALLLLETHHPEPIEQLRRSFLQLLVSQGTASSDDLHIGEQPEGVRPGDYGAAIRGLAMAGLIRKTGERINSSRRCTHARDLPLWELVDRHKADARLGGGGQ